MKKILASIVTYNRVDLLRRCLSSITIQSQRVDQILVVDNNSSDGTFEEISNICNLVFRESREKVELYEGLLNDFNVTYLRCSDNTGSAGGIYQMMTFFMGLDCDLLWIMDDDGFPEQNCLGELASLDYDVVFPLVLNEDRHSELAFSLFGVKKVEELKEKFPDDVIYGSGNPWNGVLISKKAIADVGYASQGFFIWGEEFEYICRLQRKFDIVLNKRAKFYHPEDRLVPNKYFLHKRLSFVVPENFERRWMYYRNYSYIYSRYQRRYFVLFFFRYSFYFFLLPKKNYLENITRFVRSLFIGVNGNFVNNN